MMQNHMGKLLGVISMAGIIVLSAPQVMHAKSIIWSQVFREHFINRNLQSMSIDWPSIQVRYNTRVINRDTGQPIACGATVPGGTRLEFQFIPHHFTDIAWFGTGSVFDSPYGNWNNNAQRSSGSLCVSKNAYQVRNSQTRQLTWGYFADFAVNPPNKRINGLGGLEECQTLSNGNVRCTATQRSMNAQFIFGQTFGQFYTALQLRGGCHTNRPDEPLRRSSNGSPRVVVPQQTIGCPIYVRAEDPNNPNIPTTPVVRIVGSDGAGGGRNRLCEPGVTIGYDAVSQGSQTSSPIQVRYLIDWNNDGTVNQMVPPTGYVSSIVPQRFTLALRSSGGPDTFRVAAQDNQGRISGWRTLPVVRCVDDRLIIDPAELSRFMDDNHDTLHAQGRQPGLEGLSDGEVELIMNPRVTNTVCTASWRAAGVTGCTLYRGSTKIADVANIDSQEVSPGTYTLTCQQPSGATATALDSCIQNPAFREI